MPSEEHYDSSSFNYFAIAILTFVLAFWSWKYVKVWHKAFFGKYKGICGCEQCRAKAKKLQLESRKPSFWGIGKFTIFLILWILFLYLFKVSAEGVQNEPAPLFDPYEILEIEKGATESEIRRAYRRLSLIYHPDKNKDPGAQEKYIKIAKAHDTLTDVAAREKWEKYGNPDGPQALVMGVALPAFLVQQDKMYLVLGVYVAFLVVIFPTAVICYWQSQKSLHTNQLSKKTMYYFYHSLKEGLRFKKLMEVISLSFEYVSQIKVRRADEPILLKLKPLLPAPEEREVNRNKKKPIPPYVTKHTMLFYSHFSRVTDTLSPQLMEDLNMLLKQAHHLLIGMIEITAGQRWLVPTLEAISIAQMVAQAVWSETSRMGRNTQLLQLPHFTEDSIRKCASKKWKITNILQIVKMESDKRKELLSGELGFNDVQIHDIERICDELPHDIDFTPTTEVDEDDENLGITAGAIVTFKTEFERPSKPRINPNPKVDDEPVEVHCPFFPIQKNEVWWLIVADEPKRQIMGLKRIPSLRDKLEVKIPFQAPRKQGTYVYTVFLMSDSYVGFDKKKQLKINVKKELDWEKEKAKYKRDNDPELEDFYSDEELSDEEGEDKEDKEKKEENDESASDSD